MTYEDIIKELQGQISDLSLRLAVAQAETKAVQRELEEVVNEDRDKDSKSELSQSIN